MQEISPRYPARQGLITLCFLHVIGLSAGARPRRRPVLSSPLKEVEPFSAKTGENFNRFWGIFIRDGGAVLLTLPRFAKTAAVYLVYQKRLTLGPAPVDWKSGRG